MTIDEAVAKLGEANASMVKVGQETDTLITKVTELEAAVAAAGTDVPQAVADAINAVATQARVVDEKVPDVA